jgi:hypothetical protein
MLILLLEGPWAASRVREKVESRVFEFGGPGSPAIKANAAPVVLRSRRDANRLSDHTMMRASRGSLEMARQFQPENDAIR